MAVPLIKVFVSGKVWGLCPLAVLWTAVVLCSPALGLPTYEEVRARFRGSESFLLDRNSEILHELRTDPQRRQLAWVEIEKISSGFKEAVIRSEDKRFFQHRGVDYWALGAALLEGVFARDFRGASTLSMQLASLLDPSLQGSARKRSLVQKGRQIQAAMDLEKEWTKAHILEAYLNLVSFRGELQGVAAAARGLFQKEPHGLNGNESLILASLIPSPNASVKDVIRRAVRLKEFLRRQSMDEEIRDLAEHALYGLHPIRPGVDLAPHVARRLLGKAGESVVSTLHGHLQRFAIERLIHHLSPLKDRNVGEGTLLAVENGSGHVLAYVSFTSNPATSRFVDGVMARRQAGSTLKPFLYAMAFHQRILTPASLLDDSPLDLSVASGIYQPSNYDHAFRGTVMVRQALASSMNIPAVRALELVGGETFLQTLRALGFQRLAESADFYGPALALGSVDVTLWELVRAYRTLANAGRIGELVLTSEAQRPAMKQIFSPESAFLVSHILSDREARSSTFGLENALGTRFWTAVKTGTSKDMRDNWCIGFSERYTVGVWVGNFKGEPMWDVSGLAGAPPVWLDVMDFLHRKGGSDPPTPPPGLVRFTAGPFSQGPDEWFIRGTEPIGGPSVRAEASGRIAYPPDGAVFALDPDIPTDRQRILFFAEGERGGLQWVLDGLKIEPVNGSLSWDPISGRHELLLRDGNGRVLDAVVFHVRG